MMYFVSLLSAILLAGILLFEIRRTKTSGPDLLSLILVFFSVQIVIPSIVIPIIIAVNGGSPETGTPFFDHIYDRLSPLEPLTTLIFSAWWVLSLYLGWIAVHQIVKNRKTRDFTAEKSLKCSSHRWTLVMLAGLAGMWLLLHLLGESLFESYRNLILFRAGVDPIERTFLPANLFASTQTFAFISVIGIFLFEKSRFAGLKKLFALSCMVFFGLMCASRRAFAIQAIIIYFVFVLMNRRWYFLRFIVPITTIFMPVMMFGKELMARLAASELSNMNSLDVFDKGLSASFLNGMSSVGISLVSSWATLIYLDMPLRFGVDHLLSIAQRIPVGFLFGWDKSYLPERIVRVSTDVFVGHSGQDIPPGFIGQMWLDFGFLGPIIWGIAFGIMTGFAQVLFDRFVKTYESAVLFVILLFIIALPINTGSFDFTFSVDMFLLGIFLVFIYRKPVRIDRACLMPADSDG